MFIPFPPESDAKASGPQGEGFLDTRAVNLGGKRPALAPPGPRARPPGHSTSPSHPPAGRDPSPALSQARRPNTSQRPRLRVARPSSRTPAPPRPAPPHPAVPPGPARPSAREGKGAPSRRPQRPPGPRASLAPSTYLRRPRPARAARSPTTMGRPSLPGRHRQPERPPRLSRVGGTRLPRGRAEGGPWRRVANPWARPPRIGETAERAAEGANRRRRALAASARSPIAQPRGRDQKLRPRPR